MDDELRCPICCCTYHNPVIFPCLHAACLKCALGLERPLSVLLSEMTVGSESADPPDSCDSDKGSVYSETDSGVVVTSRPSSYVSNADPAKEPPPQQPDSDFSFGARCPTCRKVFSLGPHGASGLPKFNAMTRIIARCKGVAGGPPTLPSAWGVAPPCQLCAGPPSAAAVECKQCQILYCAECLLSCHPPRGPLAAHMLEPATVLGGPHGGASSQNVVELCIPHGEKPTLHCQQCRWSGCCDCAPGHTQHELQPLEHLTKTQKAELSDSLHQLSVRAKSAHGHITSLKTYQDRVNIHCEGLAAEMERQCFELEEALQKAKIRLRTQLLKEKEATSKVYREQTASYTRKLQQTTSLVQFCIEAIKEPDPVVFMQLGPQLIGRVSDLELKWDKDVSSSPGKLSPYINLDLDSNNALKAINAFNFIQMKPAMDGEERRPAAPDAPSFTVEECLGRNNRVVATWEPYPTSKVSGYALEIDDGDQQFKEVYRGPENKCTIEGLHFNSVYNLRVRAFNSSGISPYSNFVSIRTSPAAWFSFDRDLSHPECLMLSGGAGVTCESYEHRVALASVGFSRGRHYWRFSIDSYDADADVVFGVARVNVNREIMLGKDPLGWSMYIDHQRSWFLHNSAHHGRCNGGIKVGATVGVLLDLNVGSLSFYVNGEPQGESAFNEMGGLLYPAISVNRNVTVTLYTQSDTASPHSDYDSQSDS